MNLMDWSSGQWVMSIIKDLEEWVQFMVATYLGFNVL